MKPQWVRLPDGRLAVLICGIAHVPVGAPWYTIQDTKRVTPEEGVRLVPLKEIA